MEDKKKMAAVMAAVMDYIKTEEEAAMMPPPLPAPSALPGPAAPINLWGISGRQSTMRMRNMMQMKSFHGAKLR